MVAMTNVIVITINKVTLSEDIGLLIDFLLQILFDSEEPIRAAAWKQCTDRHNNISQD